MLGMARELPPLDGFITQQYRVLGPVMVFLTTNSIELGWARRTASWFTVNEVVLRLKHPRRPERGTDLKDEVGSQRQRARRAYEIARQCSAVLTPLYV